MAPAMRRPRGPRKLRPSLETKPSVARRPRPPGLASATTGAPMPSASAGSQAIAGASPLGTAITARSRSASAAAHSPPVGEDDGHLLAARVVGVREDVPVGDHHAGAEPPAAAEADHRGADLLSDSGDGLLQGFERCHLSTPL
jgi:hypothetical protein